MSLQQGQIVKYEGSLWHVVLVNDCRAHLVPWHRTSARGVNISPNSIIEVVTDPETAYALLCAEAELAALRAALAQQQADERALAEAEAELNALRKLVNQSDE